jgi:hypothetical protein
MPCTELKELEAVWSSYAERRFATVSIDSERRKGSARGYMPGQARIAYLMQAHRQNCTKCR